MIDMFKSSRNSLHDNEKDLYEYKSERRLDFNTKH